LAAAPKILLSNKLATATGLISKMTETGEGPMFEQLVLLIIDRHRLYPHPALKQSRGLDKIGRRMSPSRCLGCRYTLRAAQKWLNVSIPTVRNRNATSKECPTEVG